MLYDHPEYYEVMFSSRDTGFETDFMYECIKRYSQIPVDRVLEIACGPAPHAGDFGRLGMEYIGLDINPTMIEFAARKWAEMEPSPMYFEANLTGFDLPVLTDFAYILLGSLYLTSEADSVGHFDSVARSVRPGGLYFLDWCVLFEDPLNTDISRDFEAEDHGIRLKSHFDIRLLDEKSHLFEETWTVDVDDHGCKHSFRVTERNRALFPIDFLQFIAKRPDWELVGWWRNWDLSQPIEAAQPAPRPIVILRRI